MFNTQHLPTSFPSMAPAKSARARLLNDPALRRNSPAPTLAVAEPASVRVTYTPLSAELIRAAAGKSCLARADQERRARQVANSFRQHMLVNLTYHAEQQMTIATIQPKDGIAQPHDTAHQICVEANGNVSVLHGAHSELSEEHLILHRLLLLAGGVAAFFGALFSLVLM